MSQTEAFANRLQKVNRHIGKWARRTGVNCYRIYDADIPEFPFCIDRYGMYVHVSEYVHKMQQDEEDHRVWLNMHLETISKELNVPAEHIFIKERKRLARRTEQYEKVADDSKTVVVEESGLKFLVNLTDYLDTGLFLDHRPLRQRFREEASAKKVLNLFAYTGSFSVYAAAGNAELVTTVDLSNTYLQWAKENMRLNGLFDEDKHKFIQGDTMNFLKQENDQLYDLVIVDPPSFSNSKKLKGTWDTQRDHAAMLHLILKKTVSGGVIYFSNNLRNFQPQFETLSSISVKDISLQTIPEDFRNKTIHRCYRIEKL